MSVEAVEQSPTQKASEVLQLVRERKENEEKILVVHIGEYKVTINCGHANEAAIESIIRQVYEFEADGVLEEKLSGKRDTRLFGKELFAKCKKHVDLYWGQHRTDKKVTGMVTPMQEMLVAADVSRIIESEAAQDIARKYGYEGIHFVAPLVSIRNNEPWNEEKNRWENQILVYERARNIKVRASKILTLGVVSMVPGFVLIIATAAAMKKRVLIEANPTRNFVKELSELLRENGVIPAYDFASQQLIITSHKGKETVYMIDTEAFRTA